VNRHGFEENEEGEEGGGVQTAYLTTFPRIKYSAVGAGYVTSKIRCLCV